MTQELVSDPVQRPLLRLKIADSGTEDPAISTTVPQSFGLRIPLSHSCSSSHRDAASRILKAEPDALCQIEMRDVVDSVLRMTGQEAAQTLLADSQLLPKRSPTCPQVEARWRSRGKRTKRPVFNTVNSHHYLSASRTYTPVFSKLLENERS